LDAINATAKACGAHLDADAVVLMVSDLWGYPDGQIMHGLARSRAEIKPERGFVTFNLSILLEKMGIVTGQSRVEAEASTQWNCIAMSFYNCGDCDFQHVSERKITGLSARGVAALKTIGGLARIVHTLIQDMHFVERDFMEAYKRQEAVENLNALPPGDSPVGELVSQLTKRRQLAPAAPEITPEMKNEARQVLRDCQENRHSARVVSEPRIITSELKDEAKRRLAEYESRRHSRLSG
jgi:hypothetical protein